MSTSMRASSADGIAIASGATARSRWWRAMKRSIMSNAPSGTPSIATRRPPSMASPGFGSAGLENAANPLAASSTAKRSSLNGRSSQSANRFQRFGEAIGPSGRKPSGETPTVSTAAPSASMGDASSLERLVPGPRSALDRRGGEPLDRQLVADHLQQAGFLLGDVAGGGGDVASE